VAVTRVATVDLSRIDADGYTCLDLLSDRQIAGLMDLIAEFGFSDRDGFFASVAHAYGPSAQAFDREAKCLVEPTVAAAVPGYRLFLVSATSKGYRDGAALPFHHDWTYTDERVHRTIFLWCPLVDTSVGNGTLQVIQGSHNWFTQIRPSRAAQPAEAFQSRLERLALPLEVRSGTAVAFDPALFHGSGPNRSGRSRPAVTFALVSDGAPLLHFHEDTDGGLQGAVVDDRFFTEHPYGSPPHRYETFAPWANSVSHCDIDAVLRRVDRAGGAPL